MTYKQTTPVPNFFFDVCLAQLTMTELKILLVIIRQTFGWVDMKTGLRKVRDRISHTQFMTKTGLSRRSTSNAIQSLHTRKLIVITDTKGNEITFAADRKGKKYLYYAVSMPFLETETCAKSVIQPAQKRTHNKTNYTKENLAKRNFSGHIHALIQNHAVYSRLVKA